MIKKSYLTVTLLCLIGVLSNCSDKPGVGIPDKFEIYYMWTSETSQGAVEVKSSSDSIIVSKDSLEKKYAISKLNRDSLFLITMDDIQNIDLSLPDQLEHGVALIMVVKSVGKSYSVQYDRITLKATSNKNVKSVFRILSAVSGQELN